MFQVLNNKNKGFTIVEVVVVIAVFLFVIGAAIGVFISILQNQRRVLAEQQLLNQISYVEEYMSKALRMAKTDLDGNCLGETGRIYNLTHLDISGLGVYTGIKFINQSDDDACQEFFLEEDGILYEKKGGNPKVALTSKDIEFDSTNPVRFLINGSDKNLSVAQCAGDDQCVQPKVTILLNVKTKIDNQIRTIQTTVSRRNLNVYQQ